MTRLDFVTLPKASVTTSSPPTKRLKLENLKIMSYCGAQYLWLHTYRDRWVGVLLVLKRFTTLFQCQAADFYQIYLSPKHSAAQMHTRISPINHQWYFARILNYLFPRESFLNPLCNNFPSHSGTKHKKMRSGTWSAHSFQDLHTTDLTGGVRGWIWKTHPQIRTRLHLVSFSLKPWRISIPPSSFIEG